MNSACLCSQYLPIVLFVNDIKNKIWYKNYHKLRSKKEDELILKQIGVNDAFDRVDVEQDVKEFYGSRQDLEENQNISRHNSDASLKREILSSTLKSDDMKQTDGVLICKIEMLGDPIFGGLTFEFDDEMPHALHDYDIPVDTFHYTIMNLNARLQRSLPCVGWIMAYGILCTCTLGLTCIPLFMAGEKATRVLEKFLSEQNVMYERDFGVHWALKKDMTIPCAWIEILKL